MQEQALNCAFTSVLAVICHLQFLQPSSRLLQAECIIIISCCTKTRSSFVLAIRPMYTNSFPQLKYCLNLLFYFQSQAFCREKVCDQSKIQLFRYDIYYFDFSPLIFLTATRTAFSGICWKVTYLPKCFRLLIFILILLLLFLASFITFTFFNLNIVFLLLWHFII